MRVRRPTLPSTLIAALSAAALLAPATSLAGTTECAPPAPAKEWQRVAPAAEGFDSSKLQDLIDFMMSRKSSAIGVYRNGCLVDTDPGAPASRAKTYESFSAAKSVVSMAAGRAMTLGLLSPDDLVGSLLPEADLQHGALTVRELLEMTTGLHWNFYRDYDLTLQENRVNDALTLPFDHTPGTYFEYAQSPVALLAEIVGRSAGMDFQEFVQRELFGPIGIQPGTWSWLRERYGHTVGFYGVQMTPPDYARLGELMLERGVWHGRRILSNSYIGHATSSSPNNPGYGWMWWVNAGTHFIGATIEGRNDRDRRPVASLPPDMFTAIGSGDQLIMVIPSLDIVLTRSGQGDSRGPETSPAYLASPAGPAELDHEIGRHLMRALIDPPMPDVGPYQPHGPITPTDPNYGKTHSATQADDLAAITQTPPLPPAGPHRARVVEFERTDLLSDGHGRTGIPLHCPPLPALPCHGSVTITLDQGLVTGTAEFDVPAGQTRIVPLELADDPDPHGASSLGGVAQAISNDDAGGASTLTRVSVHFPGLKREGENG